MIGTIKELFIKIIKHSLFMGVLNYIIGFIKPYLQAIIYHSIVWLKILFGAWLAPSTLYFMSYVMGLYLLWRYIKIIRKFL